ncbi:hypothetical protein WN944_022047 [Citrus x changshan-huyou]|uniref:Uncharacterized protein n=1 Tax=Citrus x changshan-huyou TaxID=2935761 RepID=A0AAP0MXU2_9ROSI
MEDETLKESGGIAATGICKMEKEKSRRRVEGDDVLFVRELGVLLIGCGSLVDLDFLLG